jgi:PAS domain S-box-containing protein
MKAGAADYLPKTHVSVESLDRAIRHALALRDKERQRSQAEQALRESEERFRTLVENSSDALLLVDAQGRIRYMAPSSARHFGWTPDEVVGRSLFDVVHPEDRDPIAGAMSGPLAGAGESTTVEIRVQHADGGYRTLEAVAVNHIDDPAVGAIVVNASRHYGAAAARGAAAAFAKDGGAGSAGRRRVARLHEPADRHPGLLRAGAEAISSRTIPCDTISRRFAPPASGRRR